MVPSCTGGRAAGKRPYCGDTAIPFLTLSILLPSTMLGGWKVLEKASLQETRHHLSSSSAPTSQVGTPKASTAQRRRWQPSSLLSSTPATLPLGQPEVSDQGRLCVRPHWGCLRTDVQSQFPHSASQEVEGRNSPPHPVTSTELLTIFQQAQG